MSLSDALVKIGGVALFIVGIALILGAVGFDLLAVAFISPLWSIVIGIVFIWVGLTILRGGTVTL